VLIDQLEGNAIELQPAALVFDSVQRENLGSPTTAIQRNSGLKTAHARSKPHILRREELRHGRQHRGLASAIVADEQVNVSSVRVTAGRELHAHVVEAGDLAERAGADSHCYVPALRVA